MYELDMDEWNVKNAAKLKARSALGGATEAFFDDDAFDFDLVSFFFCVSFLL